MQTLPPTAVRSCAKTPGASDSEHNRPGQPKTKSATNQPYKHLFRSSQFLPREENMKPKFLLRMAIKSVAPEWLL